MNLARIQEGDVVRVDKKGRVFMALVTKKEKGELQVEPFHRHVSYRTATAQEVREGWTKVGRERKKA